MKKPLLPVLWAIVPLANMLVFTRVPIAPLIAEGQTEMPLKKLLSMRIFWIFMLLMVCSGACEQAVSQWASTFAEQGLGISKTMGDLMGPMFFAIMMGTARALYGKFDDRFPLKKCMAGSILLCLAALIFPLLMLAGLFMNKSKKDPAGQ